jgi:hypothetical protein
MSLSAVARTILVTEPLSGAEAFPIAVVYSS